jgi:hypothetical protein
MVTSLLIFGNKNKLQVNLGDLEDESQHLCEFLKITLKTEVKIGKNSVTIDSEKITPSDLQHAATKFLYKRNLNGSHWVSLDGNIAKIERFKGSKKPEKEKKTPGHQSITQSWGL